MRMFKLLRGLKILIMVLSIGVISDTLYSDSDANRLIITPEHDQIQNYYLAENAFILRQRLVELNSSALAIPFSDLIIDLFDDTPLIATDLIMNHGSDDGNIWTGRIKGSPSGNIIISENNGSITATVRTDQDNYHIRYFNADFSIVRQIDTSKFGQHSHILAPSTLKATGNTTFETEVVSLTNQERNIENLHSLSIDSNLTASARQHSIDMADNDFMDHIGSDGSDPFERMIDAGYGFSTAAENVAAGYSTPELVVEGWMNSPGHRENILNPDFCDIGVGYAYNSSSTYSHYWTQNFGRKTGVSTCEPNASEADDTGASNASETDDSSGGCFIDSLN